MEPTGYVSFRDLPEFTMQRKPSQNFGEGFVTAAKAVVSAVSLVFAFFCKIYEGFKAIDLKIDWAANKVKPTLSEIRRSSLDLISSFSKDPEIKVTEMGSFSFFTQI